MERDPLCETCDFLGEAWGQTRVLKHTRKAHWAAPCVAHSRVQRAGVDLSRDSGTRPGFSSQLCILWAFQCAEVTFWAGTNSAFFPPLLLLPPRFRR